MGKNKSKNGKHKCYQCKKEKYGCVVMDRLYYCVVCVPIIRKGVEKQIERLKKMGEVAQVERNNNKMIQGITMFLEGMGLDLKDQHLTETPKRVVRAWLEEFGSGYKYTDKKIGELLSVDFSEDYDEMVVVKEVPFLSHCSHHLVPFSGIAKIGYVPNGKVVGLSKLARVLDAYALRLQVQERLTKQIAEAIMKHVQPLGVGVVLEASHFCMCYRGVKKPGSKMVTSCLLGSMREDKAMREEFLNL